MHNTVATQHKITWPNLLTWLLIFISLIILIIECAEPVSSSDLWWHMALGRHILTTGQFIVDHSIFTWTAATPYHLYNAWLSEIVLYLIYITTGPIGLIVLRYIIFGGFFALSTYFAIKRDIASNPLVWVIIALGLVLSFFATLIQPELFSFAFMYITVGLYFIIRTLGNRAWKLCYLFPLIIILWINSHGAFVMSAFFFISMGIGELLNAKFNSTQAMPVNLRIHLFSALGLCVIALSINPFGYHLPLHLLQNTISIQAEVTKLSTTISGWDPTAKYNGPPFYALDYLITAMFIYVFLTWQRLKNRQIDWVVVLAFLMYSVLFVKMMRTTHFFAPIFVFTSLDLLAYKENSWVWSLKKPAKAIVAVCSVILLGVIGYRTIQGAVCMSFSGSIWAGPYINSQYAVEEAEYISQLPTVKKIGNNYRNGGYLMYRLWPTMLITADPRYFPFTNWIEQFLNFEHGYGIQQFLDSHKPDIWLIDHERTVLIEWFYNSKLWSPMFVGPAGVVFAPASNTNIQIKVSSNVERTDSLAGLLAVFHTALILKNWSLAERISNQATHIANNRPGCKEYATLNHDLQIGLTGVRAFHAGDYLVAATNLSQKTAFLNLSNIAIAAYTLLGQRAWDSDNYADARAHAIEALRLQPKNTTSVYNAAITDWQYRKFGIINLKKVNDDITWQFLVDIMLKHKEKIPSTTRVYIIDVLTAMQNGSLHEKPHFIVQQQ